MLVESPETATPEADATVAMLELLARSRMTLPGAPLDDDVGVGTILQEASAFQRAKTVVVLAGTVHVDGDDETTSDVIMAAFSVQDGRMLSLAHYHGDKDARELEELGSILSALLLQ